MSETPNGVILIEVSERVATITINRPEARNALSSEVLRKLPEAVAQLEADENVDVMILTGTDPAFTAGLDLRELGSPGGNIDPGAPGKDNQPKRKPMRGPFGERTKPLIGAVNGVAVTGGFELALCCDFLVASERARFADTHARVGVMPGWGLTVLLPQAIGVRRARELSLTGNYLDAQTALEWGLVNHVVAHDDLLAFARSLAADITGNDQPGVREILGTYEMTSLATTDQAWDIESERGQAWLHASDFTPERVAERREAIQSRGRDQTS